MNSSDTNEVVIAIRYRGKIRWFRSDRDLWVLDVNKWRNEFIDHGYDVPEFKVSFRFGIHCINHHNADKQVMEQLNSILNDSNEDLFVRVEAVRGMFRISGLRVDEDKMRLLERASSYTELEILIPTKLINDTLEAL
ncbi:hypothetical protein [Hahella ganghwensis]|uniref:hypothetical protein n=1 Tax=Hahella ganghwensis TaxID=286420 RepID=UPI0003737A05|nr:hypothetical protein [Hahella ganghwensis]